MARRPLFISALLLACVVPALPRIVHAEDTPAADVDSTKYNFLGSINASAVFVRSGPREDAYPTIKLDKGAQVTVVGMKFNWLKIKPPEGSFAYVPKVYIERRGNGSIGRATRETIAKAGSALNPMKIAPMAKIDANQDVTILGEQDEYFKIAPPEGSVLYVNKNFVDPVKILPKDGTPDVKPEKLVTGAAADATKTPGPSAPEAGVAGDINANPGDTTRPSGEVASSTTQPAEAAAAAANEFDRLESEYAAAGNKPITEQPIATLQSGYDALLKQDALPPSMRRIAQVRQSTLKLRGEAQQEFAAVKASQDKSKEREKAIVAERQEIETRIKQNSVTVYAAVGTLRTSSIQHAGEVLYRLTDPETGHTVAYLRAPDTRYAAMLGQFVGVKGTIGSDDALEMKTIGSPTVVEQVDPSKVNSSIAAQLTPPSLMPKPVASNGSGAE